MKNNFLFFLVSGLFSLVSVSAAASPEYNRAYQDYTHAFNQYRRSHQEYLTAKNKYSSYQTLVAKTEALNATAEMLTRRDETLKTYLTAVRFKLSETADTTLSLSYFANMLYLNLEKEINWLTEHQSKFSSAGSFKDLLKFSQETEEKHPVFELLAYQALGTTINGRFTELSRQTKTEIDQLEKKVAAIREEGKMETTTPERWLLEAKNKFALSLQKQNQASQSLVNLKAGQQTASSFNNSIILLEESNQYLKETASYLLEIISFLRGEK